MGLSISICSSKLYTGKVAVLLTAVFVVSAGCSTVPSRPPVELRLSLDADSYQIGEPVVATALIRNQTELEVMVPALDNSTLKFYWGKPGTSMRLRREPILPKGALGRTHVISPMGVVSRTFLFTQTTPEPGEWGLMAALSGCATTKSKAELLPTFYSAAVRYKVTEGVKLERDPYSGLITKKQALTLAREYAGAAEDHCARAVLVPLGDSQLYIWTVFLDAKGDPIRKAEVFTVNPYTGAAKPLEFTETLQEEKGQ